MKFLLILLTFVTFTNSYAQITLEHSYTGVFNDHLTLSTTYLDGYGFKYYQSNCYTNELNIYNLNHTLFRHINVPFIVPTSLNEFAVYYVTTDLFDNDTSTVEYVWYGWNTGSRYYLNVVREDGTILLSDSMFYSWNQSSFIQPELIFQTDSGAKLLLHCNKDSVFKVYSLPGKLPCNDCSNFSPSNNLIKVPNSNKNDFLKIYPNPNNGEAIIEYNVPNTYNNLELIIVDSNGNEQKRIKIENPKGSIIISQYNIPSGNYILYLTSNIGLISSKKMIHLK